MREWAVRAAAGFSCLCVSLGARRGQSDVPVNNSFTEAFTYITIFF